MTMTKSRLVYGKTYELIDPAKDLSVVAAQVQSALVPARSEEVVSIVAARPSHRPWHKVTEVIWWTFNHHTACEECGAMEDRFCDVSYGQKISVVYCLQCAPDAVMECEAVTEVEGTVDADVWQNN